MNLSPPWRYKIGLDENGLGPRLGPMIVTGVLTRASAGGWSAVNRAPRGAVAQRLGDSKAYVKHGDVALGEAWARVLLETAHPELRFECVDDVVGALSLDGRETLLAPCPTHVKRQCWETQGEAFSADPDLLHMLRRDVERLAQKGIEIVGVRSVIVCTKQLNLAADKGVSRFSVDLHAMERLILHYRSLVGTTVHATCGKVGGFGKYSNAFGPLSGHLHSVLKESREESRYWFPDVGEISFIQDSDASDLCVAMASMVGKYLREVLMARIVRHYQRELPDAMPPDASGYHDPVTARFVGETLNLRKRARVPDDCFERKKAATLKSHEARAPLGP